MSVVSVPLDDGAIGDGSAMSLRFEARGECTFGGCKELEISFDLKCQLGAPGRMGKTYEGRDKGAGDVGESEYGENAEMRERSGEGNKGDFKAISRKRPREHSLNHMRLRWDCKSRKKQQRRCRIWRAASICGV